MSNYDFMRAVISATWESAVGTSPSPVEVERALPRVTERLAPDFGGLAVRVYIAKRTQWQKSRRAQEILSKWNGRNIDELARQYGLSPRRVRQIVQMNGKS